MAENSKCQEPAPVPWHMIVHTVTHHAWRDGTHETPWPGHMEPRNLY